MTASRYIVGIDLGTTNSAVAYIDTGVAQGEEPTVVHMPVPQLVQPGVVEPRPLLPSFLYLPGENELPAGSLKLSWDPNPDRAIGEFARNQGNQVPTRLVASAKSWLSHGGVDRRGAILPWKAPDTVRKISPLEASTAYLRHLAEAWNHQVAKDVPENRLERQDIILTVPASFDAVARELTVEAARAAGLEHLGGKVQELRAAYGGMAARAMRAVALETAVQGRPWEPAWLPDIETLLARDFTPIGDHRGGAAYRLRAAAGLLRRFQFETSSNVTVRVEAL